MPLCRQAHFENLNGMVLLHNKGKSRGEKRCGHYRAAKAVIIQVTHGFASLFVGVKLVYFKISSFFLLEGSEYISRLDIGKWLMR